MSALIRSEERKKCSELGLQVVHLQALDYLSRCNRYSDTPASLANYLGMTRGTVSQTLLLLEKKGFIKKTMDLIDRRKVHLSLLDSGLVVLAEVRDTHLFHQARKVFEHDVNNEGVEAVFVSALKALQKAHKGHSFGQCETCKYFTEYTLGFRCELTKEPLSLNDSSKLCQEHSLE
ncbi:MAG: MarR family winged helix-turn-helix transcriptional regulator [Methylococcales bacterium]|nr:MarR family winged helix-turn-helix transcriptional regulator [Methylococcales bacterium]